MKPRIIYPKRNRKLAERLNTPWLCIPVTIGFVVFCAHAYPIKAQALDEFTSQAVESYDSSKTRDYKPRPSKFDTGGIVYLYGNDGLVGADWFNE